MKLEEITRPNKPHHQNFGTDCKDGLTKAGSCKRALQWGVYAYHEKES